ncbi:rRNA maturation RNase YbeY [Prochlorococcus marinus]|uniref:Endoribonuclease YbeY n=1 Tax=Prochlorococcus marinus (strain MIT 9211) TaxID=93059 RepID=YBEY_PROM4|nr:rRNA maturation RNase YbeY [Prochlorococcus marinus]A9BD43.1 RecName: Full=Endoribonuclease YbeY [Prochlorococcus marinus str. MIT 9211]ABX08131.1 Predicted metal-dependent hydrolase [Prochlorococcus marinus str. MIT 9211]
MLSASENRFEIDLDLVFHSYQDAHLINNIFFNNEALWRSNLKVWIDYVRRNDNYLCPAIVRSVNCLSIGLQFTDDKSIMKINQQWRAKEEPTDVLSFPVIDQDSIAPPPNHFLELGDIIVSVQTAQKQADENNHSLDKELCWLVSHGLLHLLGWDHLNEHSLDQMLSFQDKLLQINHDSQIAVSRGLQP